MNEDFDAALFLEYLKARYGAAVLSVEQVRAIEGLTEPRAVDCTHPTWKAKTMRCATCDKPWGSEEQAAVDRIIRANDPTPKKKISVTVEQVLAARITVACEARLGRVTPPWVIRLAETEIPLRLIEETP